jgi:hypothetical protein
MLHPVNAYQIANCRYEDMRRESEKVHKLRRMGFIPESPWRRHRKQIVRLISLFF